MDVDIAKLAKQAQNGDAIAFGQIYDHFAQRLFRFIKQKISDQAQAEDILQETFIKAWKGLPKLTIHESDSKFSAWLFKVAKNTINDYFRKIYRSPLTSPLDEVAFNLGGADSPQKDAMRNQDAAALKIALQQLPPQYRQILELRFVQEFSVRETCEILGKNSLAVRVGQYRALKKLREILKNSYDYGYEQI